MTRPTESSPATPAAVPANEFERFLAALPEPLREDCRTRLSGSGLSPDHPVFQVLADFYEKKPVPNQTTRDFIEEARLHADQTKQILSNFEDLPGAVMARLEPQILGAVAAFNAPIGKLEATATHLQRNVEALPVLLLSKRGGASPRPDSRWKLPGWWIGNLVRTGASPLPNPFAWLVMASVTLGLALGILGFGASHLSRYYETSYQQRLARLEADSVENTIALNRLLAAGIALKVERDADDSSYFLILGGARKAADPISTPEGLAIQIWP